MENKDLTLTADLDLNGEAIEIIGINSICRLCASQNERLIGIFSDEGLTNDLGNKINSYLPVKVCISDVLPLQCCWNCASTVLAWHELVLNTVETDKKFKTSQIITEKEILGGALCESSTPSDEPDGSKDPLEIKEDKNQITDDSTPPQRFSCNVCGKNVTRKHDLKRHKLTCKPYRNVIATATDLKTNSCVDCFESFQSLEDLEVHNTEKHCVKAKRRRSKSQLTPNYFCDVCNKGFTRKHDMKRHMVHQHKDKINVEQYLPKRRSKPTVETYNGNDLFVCETCGKRFTQFYYLTRHRTVHTESEPYCCHLCGKAFRRHGGLTRHIRTFHQSIRNFKCETCSRKFATRQTLIEHINTHTNARPYVCNLCPKSFKQRASLQIHLMYHSQVKRFECDTCGKKYRRPHELKVHSWLHTGVKPYECTKCNASFRLSQVLKRHLKTHDRIKECVCDYCGCAFSHEKYLTMHKKIHQRDPLAVD